MNPSTMFKLSYGLYVLSAHENEKDNACIINTAAQVTSSPNRISVAVNKQNYTHGMIQRTGVFNVCLLTTQTPFDVFVQFGFQSGSKVDKFTDATATTRAQNGVLYTTNHTNAFISGKVSQEIDLGTHTLFIADVTDAEILSEIDSLTYAYYHKHTKPAPKKAEIKGYRCKICGYIHEGDNLPADFVCPLCKHGPDDFEQI